jgi:hypothetical protein
MTKLSHLKTKDLPLLLAVVVALILAAFWMFPSSRHADIALAGPPGLRVSGFYECDGIRTNFAVVVPSTVSLDFRRHFEFYAAKDDRSANFTASLTSSFMSSSAETNGDFTGVKASYSSPFPGFSSGSMRAAKAPKNIEQSQP